MLRIVPVHGRDEEPSVGSNPVDADAVAVDRSDEPRYCGAMWTRGVAWVAAGERPCPDDPGGQIRMLSIDGRVDDRYPDRPKWKD